jgi:tetratricopeptide (TPR) repeat protein
VSAFAAMPDELSRRFIALREAVFAQNIRADAAAVLYDEAIKQAESELSGCALDAMRSRGECLLGKAYQLEERNAEALACFERGIAAAEKSIAAQPTAEGYEALSANYGQACLVKPRSWVIANGLKIEQYAQKGLELDPRNAACRYLISSRWVFGPGIFGNPRRGIAEMEAMLTGDMDLQKDDLFNVYSAIAYGYIKLKEGDKALPWVRKALEVYPTNTFALGLLEQIK